MLPCNRPLTTTHINSLGAATICIYHEQCGIFSIHEAPTNVRPVPRKLKYLNKKVLKTNKLCEFKNKSEKIIIIIMMCT